MGAAPVTRPRAAKVLSAVCAATFVVRGIAPSGRTVWLAVCAATGAELQAAWETWAAGLQVGAR